MDNINYDEYLMASRYLWHDIIRLSIEENISIERMIDKMIDNKSLDHLDKVFRKDLLKHIDTKILILRKES